MAKKNSGPKYTEEALKQINDLWNKENHTDALKKQINDTLRGLGRLAGGLDGFNDALDQAARLTIQLASDGTMLVTSITDMIGSIRDMKMDKIVGDPQNLAKGATDATDSATSAAGDAGSKLGSILGSVLGGLGAGMSIVSGIVGIFNRQAEEEKKYRREQEEALRRRLSSETELSLVISRRLIDEQAITREKYKQIEASLKKSSDTRKDVLNDMNVDKYSWQEKLGQDYSSLYKGKVRDYLNALKELMAHKDDLEWLQTVGDSPLINKSDDLFAPYQEFQQRLLKLAEQEKEWREQQKQLAEETMGSSVGSLGDMWVEAFKKGEEATWDFAKNFRDVMRQAIVNGFADSVIGAQMEPIFNKFRDKVMGYLSGDLELDEVVTPELQREVDRTAEKIKELSPELRKILEGFGLEVDNSGLETMSAAIKGVSEETASLVAGQMNAIRTNQVKSMEMFEQSLAALGAIEANTRYNRYLESIDKRLGSMNSGGGSSLRAAGLA